MRYGGDLAEYYRADKLYPAGTLVTVGDGHEEIIIAKTVRNGIICSFPGYELGNKDSAFDLPLALVGKVPVLFAPAYFQDLEIVFTCQKIILAKHPIFLLVNVLEKLLIDKRP